MEEIGEPQKSCPQDAHTTDVIRSAIDNDSFRFKATSYRAGANGVPKA